MLNLLFADEGLRDLLGGSFRGKEFGEVSGGKCPEDSAEREVPGGKCPEGNTRREIPRGRSGFWYTWITNLGHSNIGN